MKHENNDVVMQYFMDMRKLYPKNFGGYNLKDIKSRPLYITVSEAAYGSPSAVIIQFEGSPPRASVFASWHSSSGDFSTLVVGDSKKVAGRHNGGKSEKVEGIIINFLKDMGYLEGYKRRKVYL